MDILRTEKHIVKCPHCGGDVLDHMTQCVHCQAALNPGGMKPLNRAKLRKTKWILDIVGAGAVAAILWWCLLR